MRVVAHIDWAMQALESELLERREVSQHSSDLLLSSQTQRAIVSTMVRIVHACTPFSIHVQHAHSNSVPVVGLPEGSVRRLYHNMLHHACDVATVPDAPR